MKEFKKLKIWQVGFQIAVNCYKITAEFPKEESLDLAIKSIEPQYLSLQTLQRVAAGLAQKNITGLLQYLSAQPLSWKRNFSLQRNLALETVN